jgi:hypothetical protein
MTQSHEMRESQVRSVQPPAMKLELSDAVTRADKKHQHGGVQCNRNFQSPDYSKISPRVDTASQVTSSRMVQKMRNDDMNTEAKETEDQGFGCFRWWRRRKTKKEINVPVPYRRIQLRSQHDTSPTLMLQCDGKGDLVRDRKVTCAQGNDIKPASSDTVNRAYKTRQQAGVHRIRQFPIPDYSKLSPKVDTWRRKPKIAGEGNDPPSDDGLLTSIQESSSHIPKRSSHLKGYQGRVHSVELTSSPAKLNVPSKQGGWERQEKTLFFAQCGKANPGSRPH